MLRTLRWLFDVRRKLGRRELDGEQLGHRVCQGLLVSEAALCSGHQGSEVALCGQQGLLVSEAVLGSRARQQLRGAQRGARAGDSVEAARRGAAAAADTACQTLRIL